MSPSLPPVDLWARRPTSVFYPTAQFISLAAVGEKVFHKATSIRFGGVGRTNLTISISFGGVWVCLAATASSSSSLVKLLCGSSAFEGETVFHKPLRLGSVVFGARLTVRAPSMVGGLLNGWRF